jgi:two-component system, NtrC family, nitrogen regulation sensor histidine kinase NtrY
MGYRNFREVSLLRVLLLCATLILFSYLVLSTSYYVTALIAGLLAAYETYALIQHVERTNRELSRFLEAIRHGDFSQSFSGAGLGPIFDELRLNFNEVFEAFRRARSEKEEQYRYLQTVVQHVGVGLICYQRDGEVELMNNAAKRLLRTNELRNINALQTFSRDLTHTLFRLQAGEKALVRVEDNGERLQLAISATELRMRGQVYILASVQNIQSELEEKEMEAWQNLVRVLTHEIMNSITPISSLASTVNELLNSAESDLAQRIAPDALEDVRTAVQTIQRRSVGLLHFVETYRKISRIPKPKFQILPAAELFPRVERFMRVEMDKKSIEFQSSIEPETLELTIDPELIEQVLINLILNSIQALEGRPGGRIELRARMDAAGRSLIQVRDNGPGILEEVQEKIFIPFFTTRQEGSGIGLSLSRQIMRLHRGSISVYSVPDVETVFTLKF